MLGGLGARISTLRSTLVHPGISGRFDRGVAFGVMATPRISVLLRVGTEF